MAEITESQVLADFAAALGYTDVVTDPNAKTVPQLLKEDTFRGISERTLQKKLRKATAKGVMERVEVVRNTRGLPVRDGEEETRWGAYRLREQ